MGPPTLSPGGQCRPRDHIVRKRRIGSRRHIAPARPEPRSWPAREQDFWASRPMQFCPWGWHSPCLPHFHGCEGGCKCEWRCAPLSASALQMVMALCVVAKLAGLGQGGFPGCPGQSLSPTPSRGTNVTQWGHWCYLVVCLLAD